MTLPAPGARAHEVPPVVSPRGLVGSLALASAAMSLMHTLAVPLLPALPRVLGTSITATSWVASATMIAGAIATPIAGRIGDLYGKRRVVLVSLGLAVAGSSIGALSASLPVLLVGRTLQGLALGVIPVSIALLRDLLPARRLGRGVAALSTATLALGTGFGPVVMGAVLDLGGWHAVFWTALGLSALSFVLAAAFVPETCVRRPARFDWLGAAGLSGALVLMLLAITRGGEWGWTSPVTVATVVSGVMVAVGWMQWERTREAPLVDLAMARTRAMAITHAASAMIGFTAFLQYIAAFTLVSLPDATGFGLGRSMMVASLTQVPGAVVMIAAAPVAARVHARWGVRALMTVGAAGVAAGLGLGVVAHTAVWHVTLTATVYYAGVGLAYCGLPMLVMANVPASDTGAANALASLTRAFGSVFGAAAASAVLAASAVAVAGAPAQPGRSGFVGVYALGALTAAGVVVVMQRLPDAR